MGIRRSGDIARQRDFVARPALSRPRRLREQFRRVEEPVGLGRLHHPRPQALPVDGRLPSRWCSTGGILFVRLADPNHHREAITSRPLLLQAIGRQTSHAGRTTVTVTSSHGEHERASLALTRIAGFFAQLRKTAEQLTALERWYRILTQALKKYLRRKKTRPAAAIAGGSCQLRLSAVKNRQRKSPNSGI